MFRSKVKFKKAESWCLQNSLLSLQKCDLPSSLWCIYHFKIILISLHCYLYLCGCLAFMYAFELHMYLSLQRPEEGARCLGTRVKDSCKMPCWCWESKWCLLEEYQVLFTSEMCVHLLN